MKARSRRLERTSCGLTIALSVALLRRHRECLEHAGRDASPDGAFGNNQSVKASSRSTSPLCRTVRSAICISNSRQRSRAFPEVGRSRRPVSGGRLARRCSLSGQSHRSRDDQRRAFRSRHPQRLRVEGCGLNFLFLTVRRSQFPSGTSPHSMLDDGIFDPANTNSTYWSMLRRAGKPIMVLWCYLAA